MSSGIPRSDDKVLRLQFKLWSGSKKVDSEKAVQFAAYLVDAIGSTIKLSRDVRCWSYMCCSQSFRNLRYVC